MDFGTHFDGYLIDSAFTIAFNPKYENLLKASQEGTETGLKHSGPDANLGEIGAQIEETIKSFEVELDGKVFPILPVKNLCGHQIEQYHIHAGKSVPIVKENTNLWMWVGEFFAIETFASTGKGKIYE